MGKRGLGMGGRLLVTATSAVGVAIGATLLGEALGLLEPMRLALGSYTFTVSMDALPVERKALWGVAGAVIALLSLVLLRAALRTRSSLGREVFIISSGRGRDLYGAGEVAITARCVRGVAAFAAQRLHGVLEASSSIDLRRKGWFLDLQIVLTPDASLPDVVSDLRPAVHEALLKHTGLPIARLRIVAQLDPISKGVRVY